MRDDDRKDAPVSDEDARLLDLLDRLGPETAPAERQAVETLGALPWALEELPVRAGVKRRVMESVAGRAAPVARRRRWHLPLAAGLAVALLGIAGFQFRRLESQQRTIDELSSRLERIERDGAELAEARRLLAERGGQMRMITSRGAEFCLLKPVGERPRYPDATATMVISPDRRRWYLAAEGLEPCATGVCYRLWFVTDAEPIHAASFDAAAEERRIELTGSHEGVPAGVRAIAITRDAEPEQSSPPETVLLADQAMALL